MAATLVKKPSQQSDMERRIFDLELQMQRSVAETTAGLEILSYSVPVSLDNP